ncbi:MAG: LamG-like jellyroll fold domain-containing protein [Planctomycetia bacterium]|nr:LamG-like jellyroll fold domain-containing protein [Planctomycetia bacterium]
MSDFNSNNLEQLAVLTDQYISGKITSEESKELLDLIESNPDFREFWCLNVLCDFTLCQKKEILSGDQIKSPDYRDQVQSGFFLNRKFTIDREDHSAFDSPFDQNRSNFEDLIPWEKEESEPIRISPPEEPPKRNLLIRILHKWSEYDREKRNQTTRSAPTVYGKKTNFFFLIWLIAFISFITWLSLNGSNKKEKNYVPVFVSLGQIQNLVDVEWPENSIPYKNGQHLGSGRFSLNKGIMQVQLANGAEVYLEGPGEYLFINQDSCYCDQGKISAHVPPSAKGFQIDSPFGTFIDRGTEFAVTIDQKTAILDVIKGRVDVSIGNTPEPIQTRAGKSFEIFSNRSVSHGEADPKRYLDAKTFDLRLTQFVERKQREMNTLNQQFDSRPGLLARFDFSSSKAGIVDNLSTQGRNLLRQASIHGGSSVPGRLRGSSALAIQKRQDSISTDLKYQFTSMTLSAWVRIDHLKNTGNVLIAGNNFFNSQNEFLWQVVQDGRLQFQINEVGTRDGNTNKTKNSSQNGGRIGFSYFESEPVIRPLELGGWFHLAVVVDAAKKTITHYLDGKAVSTHEWKNTSPLICDGLTIANINGSTTNARFFDGVVSDFFIFDRALTPDEIAQWAQ